MDYESMDGNKPPRPVFLCHTSSDKAIVRKIARALEDFGISIWFDEWEIKAGQSIPRKVSGGLKQSGILLVFLSPAALASEWVQRELNAALMQQLSSQRITVIPVKLKKCTVPDILCDIKWISLIEADSYERGLRMLLEAIVPEEEVVQLLDRIPDIAEELRLSVGVRKPSDAQSYVNCPSCDGPALSSYSVKQNVGWGRGFEFDRGIQCLQCGVMFDVRPATKCPKCGNPMIWKFQGMSEGPYGQYEDDFAFECPKCGTT